MSTTFDQVTSEHPLVLDDTILHENDLTEQAKSRFSYHGDILRGFESYRQSILRNECLTHASRHAVLSGLVEIHTKCKRVLNYVAEHSELLDCSLPALGPLFIIGLPRTGTTLLHNLLACDPDCRTPLFTDMCLEIVPPISRLDLVEQKKRMDASQLSMQRDTSFATIRSQITAAHPFFPIDEDYHILRQASFLPLFMMITSDHESEHGAWLLDETKKDYAYDYHEVFLRMLNSVDAPRSHWLLKSPMHCLKLDTLLQHYPNAGLIMTHRHLDEVLPSFCSLAWTLASLYLDKENAASQNKVTTHSLQFIDKAIECIMQFRTRQNCSLDQSKKNVFDVDYNDLMEQPINTVHRIYDHFGLRWSEEFEAAMDAWLRDNPQGKQGRHIYNLTECGLTPEDIKTRYADYINLFHCSPPADTVSASHDQFSSDNEPVEQA